MSTPSVGRGRRRAWLLATLLGVFGLFLFVGAGNALAASCSWNNGLVTITLGNETGTVSVGNLSQIKLNGIPCLGAQTATTSNTDLIWVIGTGAKTAVSPGDTLVIDESGGMFQPGATAESGGTNEIEFLLGIPGFATGTPANIANDAVENLVVNGNAAPDHIFVGDGLAYTQNTAAADPELGADATFTGPSTWAFGAAPADNEVPLGSIGFLNLNGDGDADVFLAADATGNTGNTSGLTDCGTNTGLAGDCLISVSLFGNAGADDIEGVGTHGTGAANLDIEANEGLFISGGPGDDSLIGGSGDDYIQPGAGNDVVDGGDDTSGEGGFCESLFNTQGNPDIFGAIGDTVSYTDSTGPVTVDLDPKEVPIGAATTPNGTTVIQNVENIDGSPAGDTLSGDNTPNVILGEGGDDKIAGDAGNDCEFGQGGNDTFDENEGTSLAQGGTGTDNGADLMLGGEGLDDTVDYSSRTTRVDVYLEPLPNFVGNIFTFLNGVDEPILSGEFCGLVAMVAPGGRAVAHRATNGVGQGFPNGFVALPDGADLNGDGDAVDAADEFDCVFEDTENAVGGSGNDILDANFLGNRSDNEFTGNGGNDLEVGGAGNDIFHEGAAANGADDMDGGTGSDTCDYSQRTGNLNVSIDGSDNDGEAGEGDNCGGVVAGTPTIAVDLTCTSPFDRLHRQVHGATLCTIGFLPFPGEGQPSSPQNTENISGGSGADVLSGNDQQNVLNGNAGNDVLSGLGGPDSLSGGDGDDVLSGGAGNDAVDGGAGTDTLDESSGGSSGVGVVINLSTGQLSGDGNDSLTGLENATGSSFADKLTGDAGNNVLNGRGGNDAIQGKDGDDTINGGDGADELGGGAGNDAIDGGRGNDTARGGAGDDSLTGGPGADTLLGGGGDDLLSGGAGKDFMNGNAGTDRCVPGAPGFAHGDQAVNCES